MLFRLIADARVVRNRVFSQKDGLQPAKTVKNPVSFASICPNTSKI